MVERSQMERKNLNEFRIPNGKKKQVPLDAVFFNSVCFFERFKKRF